MTAGVTFPSNCYMRAFCPAAEIIAINANSTIVAGIEFIKRSSNLENYSTDNSENIDVHIRGGMTNHCLNRFCGSEQNCVLQKWPYRGWRPGHLL